MIPLKLRLRNFMCYRENVPPLDFQGIHVACLAGDNGHGKSALLDAITWALWGKSRASSDDALVHLGQTEMEVELEFALEGNRYRVIRKRRKRQGRRSGQTALELQVWDGQRFRSISEPTVRATEARIRQLLRLDYETFINSAFLVQGRADEFTTKRPSERKQVLADILGLGIYDELAERARDRARERAAEVEALVHQIRQIEEELGRRPQYEAEEREAARRVTELSARLREEERKLDELRARQRDLLHQQQALEDLERRLAQEEAELARLESQLAEGEARLRALERLLAEREAIEKGYQAWQEARADEQAWRERQLAWSRLQTRRARLEGEVQAARAALEAEIQALETQMRRWEEQAAQREVREQAVGEARGRLEELSALAEEATALRERRTGIADELAQLSARNEVLRAEMESLKERTVLLREAEATCPVCGQPLSEDERRRLVASLEAEGKAKADQYRGNLPRMQELEEERTRLDRRLAWIERELRQQATWQRRLARAEQELAEARQAAQALAEAEATAKRLRERLQRGDYAAEARAALAALAQEEATVGYDEAAHRRAQAAVAEYAPFEERYAALQRAIASIDAERRAVTQLTERREALTRALAELRQRRDEMARALQALPEVEAAVRAQDGVVSELAAQEEEARLRLGAARQRLDACRALEETRAQRERALRQAREEQAIYEELREAFGKRGLQAMIIETVTPEIEAEANRLLARMTDGRMSISLQTQRESQRGEAIETLDIIIQDELGPRPYEMFSGGEAFRVNFALRIALSKLLARRAGTRLQTLFIDEGFGSQDAQGRQRLVEAIQSIQDDFARILVITHIEELRDLFPVRIDVVKTPEGSQILLN